MRAAAAARKGRSMAEKQLVLYYREAEFVTRFAAYLEKKRSEGKHYNVALSHVVKKLVRLIYVLQTSGKAYCPIT